MDYACLWNSRTQVLSYHSNNTVFQSPVRMYVLSQAGITFIVPVTLTWRPWPRYSENAPSEGFQKLEHKQDRQTDRHTHTHIDRRDRTHYQPHSWVVLTTPASANEPAHATPNTTTPHHIGRWTYRRHERSLWCKNARYTNQPTIHKMTMTSFAITLYGQLPTPYCRSTSCKRH